MKSYFIDTYSGYVDRFDMSIKYVDFFKNINIEKFKWSSTAYECYSSFAPQPATMTCIKARNLRCLDTLGPVNLGNPMAYGVHDAGAGTDD